MNCCAFRQKGRISPHPSPPFWEPPRDYQQNQTIWELSVAIISSFFFELGKVAETFFCQEKWGVLAEAALEQILNRFKTDFKSENQISGFVSRLYQDTEQGRDREIETKIQRHRDRERELLSESKHYEWSILWGNRKPTGTQATCLLLHDQLHVNVIPAVSRPHPSLLAPQQFWFINNGVCDSVPYSLTFVLFLQPHIFNLPSQLLLPQDFYLPMTPLGWFLCISLKSHTNSLTQFSGEVDPKLVRL